MAVVNYHQPLVLVSLSQSQHPNSNSLKMKVYCNQLNTLKPRRLRTPTPTKTVHKIRKRTVWESKPLCPCSNSTKGKSHRRYVPTCNEYSMQAYKKYGVAKGTVLTAWRLCRCNPLGGSGYDPPRWFDETSLPEEE